MLIFRWVMGVLTALLAVGAIGSFLIFIAADLPHWLDRARKLRTWVWISALFWFNVEVWGRVVYTIVTWNR